MKEKWRNLFLLFLLQFDVWQNNFSKPRKGVTIRGAYRRQPRRIENVISTNRMINIINSIVGFKSPKAANPTMIQNKIIKSILQIIAEQPR